MRIYVIVTLALLAALLTFYVPARIERANRFEQFGAGYLATHVGDLIVDWRPTSRQMGRVVDKPTIEAVIELLSPHVSSWTEPPTVRRTDWGITFRSEAQRRAVVVRFGENCAVCGNFTRALRPGVIAEIRQRLLQVSMLKDVPRL